MNISYLYPMNSSNLESYVMNLFRRNILLNNRVFPRLCVLFNIHEHWTVVRELWIITRKIGIFQLLSTQNKRIPRSLSIAYTKLDIIKWNLKYSIYSPFVPASGDKSPGRSTCWVTFFLVLQLSHYTINFLVSISCNHLCLICRNSTVLY